MRASCKPLKSFDGFLAYCRAAFSGRATCGAAAIWYNLARRNAMLTKSEWKEMLASMETCRIARTKSTIIWL